MTERYILDANGRPQPCDDLMTWARWMEDGNRVLRKTEIGGVRVSTVFLGLDHSFGEGPPVLWETMIFGGEHDQYQDHYASEAAAIQGHEYACGLVAAPSN